ncbi:VOC family protein [Bailinhaonella thermotolerans]|uniref:VOC family protein n=1 Tax=Bailinhaonella thermotolerans TaxID=1070861 RepID=A0A3A4AYM8_9ACTN|nr:VOC family protein [Bailinhaonella thermotolerans]RJL30953.1 VOC family protein [Bailinhaonella thermotolerans]
MEIHAITFDVADPYKIASFWSEAMGWPMEEGSEPGADDVWLIPEGSPPVLFQRVPEGKIAKNRVHLDIMPSAGRSRDQEVERMFSLGATALGDFRTEDGKGWVTMLDPEGNEFCVVRGNHERVND